MDNQSKGLLYIIFGILIIFFAASELVVRILFILLGFYLVNKGLQLRTTQNILFFFQRFKNRF